MGTPAEARTAGVGVTGRSRTAAVVFAAAQAETRGETVSPVGYLEQDVQHSVSLPVSPAAALTAMPRTT